MTIPAYPENRLEEYLDEIARNGTGGGGGGGSTGGGVLVVHEVDGILDKTWEEIADADVAVVKHANEYGTIGGIVLYVQSGGGMYAVGALAVGNDTNPSFDGYITASADGYPTYQNPDNPNNPDTPMS